MATLKEKKREVKCKDRIFSNNGTDKSGEKVKIMRSKFTHIEIKGSNERLK